MYNGKKLTVAAVSVTIAFVMLITATLAWYTISTNPEITGMNVQIGSVGKILLATKDDPDNFVETINLSHDFDGYSDLTPVSTVDGIHWYLPTYDATTGFPSSDVNDFILDDDLTYANVFVYETDESGALVTDTEGGYISLEGLELLEQQKKGYYVYTDFYLKVTGEETGGATVRLSVPHYGTDAAEGELNNTFGTYVIGTYSTTTTDTDGDGDIDEDDTTTLRDISYQAQTAMRVGFLVYGNGGNTSTDFIIFEPNADQRSEITDKPTETGAYVVDYQIDATEYVTNNYIVTKPVGVVYNSDNTIKTQSKTITVERGKTDENGDPIYIQDTDEEGNLLWEQEIVKKQATDGNGIPLYEQCAAYIKKTVDNSEVFIQVYGTVGTTNIPGVTLPVYIYNGDSYEYAKDYLGRSLYFTYSNPQPVSVLNATAFVQRTDDDGNIIYKQFYGTVTTDGSATGAEPIYIKSGSNPATYTQAIDSDNNPLYATGVTVAETVTVDDLTRPIYEQDGNGNYVQATDANGNLLWQDSAIPKYKLDSDGNEIQETETVQYTKDVPVADIVDIDPSKLVIQRASAWRYKTSLISDEDSLLYKLVNGISLNSLDVTFGKFLNSNTIYSALGYDASTKTTSSTSITLTDNEDIYTLSYDDSETAGNSIIISLENDNPVRIRMFIWIEGQDVDCWNDIACGNFKVNIELASYSWPAQTES